MADIVVSNTSPNPVVGTDQDDSVTLNGNASGFTFNLLNGNDSIEVGTSGAANFTNAVVYLGDGSDTIGGAIVKSENNYTLIDGGIGSNSIVYGNMGDDRLRFSNAADTGISIYGGQGADIVAVDSGDDFLIEGNIGNDQIYIHDDVSTSTVLGGQGTDVIEDDGSSNIIYGNTGDDTIRSAGVGTTIYGGQDNDLITNFADDDNSASASGSSQLVYGNLGDDQITFGDTSTVYGGQGSDAITAGYDEGSATGSVVYGNLGNDVIDVADGATTVFGGQGNDSIVGFGTDTILNGNLGNDTFNVGNGDAAGGDGDFPTATIGDFVTGTDKVNIGGDAAVAGTGGNYTEVSDTAITTAEGAAAAAAPGQEYTFVAGATDGYLVYSDGDGGTLTATLSGLNSLDDFAASDIQGDVPPT